MTCLSDLCKWLPFGSTPEITASELWQTIESGEVQMIDVRTSTEWKSSAIEGSNNIPITELTHEAVDALGFDKEEPVVAICLSAHRSIPAVRVLKEMGFEDARQLQGGMMQWWKQNLPCCKN